MTTPSAAPAAGLVDVLTGRRTWHVEQGDCLAGLPTLPDGSIDAIVTDPPYELGFMGKSWDRTGIAFQHEVWVEAIRVLKPGGHLLAMGGSRTEHRMTCAIEDAGFEIRDKLVWLHGSGFPKSLNVSAVLEETIPADSRCVCEPRSSQTTLGSRGDYPGHPHSDDGRPLAVANSGQEFAPSQVGALARSRVDRQTDAQASLPASIFSGAGSARRASDCSARRDETLSKEYLTGDSTSSDKPMSTSPAELTERHRTAAGIPGKSCSADASVFSPPSPLDSGHSYISHCTRCGGLVVQGGIGTALKPAMELIVLARKPLAASTVAGNVLAYGTGALNIDGCRIGTDENRSRLPGHGSPDAWRLVNRTESSESHPAGRWPANVVLTHSPECDKECVPDCPVAELDRQSGVSTSSGGINNGGGDTPVYGTYTNTSPRANAGGLGDTGGASRFFFTAKASRAEREIGTYGMDSWQSDPSRNAAQVSMNGGEGNPYKRGVIPRRNNHPTVKPVSLMRWLCLLVTPPGGIVLDCFAGSGSTGIAALREGFRFIGIEREADYVTIANKRIEGDAPLFNRPEVTA